MAFITAETRSDLIELSVAMLKQAPSAALLEELIALSVGGGSLADAADHIAKTDAFKAEYPSFQTAEQYAAEIFDNITTGGTVTADIRTAVIELATGMLTSGSVTKAGLALAIAEYLAAPAALLNTDFADIAQSFQNRADAAEYFVVDKELGGSTDAELAAAIASVTSDAATLTAANTAADATASAEAVVAGQTFTLTTGTDFVSGTAGNDLINAARAGTNGTTETYSPVDQIAGGEGTDTLYAETDTAINLATVTGVENVQINAADAAFTSVVTLANDAAYKELHSVNSVGSLTFNSIKNGDVNGALIASADAQTTTYNYASTALLGATDNLDVQLSAADGTLAVTGGSTTNALETLTLNSISDSALDAINLTGANTTKLVITGAGATSIPAITQTEATLATYDASAATGAVSLTGINVTGNTISGGAGNDALTGAAGNDVITGGAGADTIIGGAGNDNLDGGAGNDVIAFTSAVTKDDVATGGDGVDTLSLAVGTTYSATQNEGIGISGFEAISNSAAITQNMSGLGENAIGALVIGSATTATIQEGAISSVVASTASGGAVLGLKTDSAADSLAVALGSATGARSLALSALDYESITISSTGTNGNSVTLGTTEAGYLVTTAAEIAAQTAAAAARTVTDLTTLTITGSKDLTVTANAKDKALATVEASTFTGTNLTVAASASTAAMTVTANGAYKATITTGTGADTVTVGDGGSLAANIVTTGTGNDTITSGAGADTISASGGNNTISSGAGNDGITTGTGADVIDAGAGNDTISASSGANNITAGDGDDNVTTTTDNDTVDGGAGNDTINTGAGNDSVVGGAGNDNIDTGAGNDNVSGGDGNDTITVGTGDDIVDGGAGNDSITISTLTNGDSIVGGTGTDSLTLSAIASSSTPKNISGVESLIVTALGGGGTAITVDLTNVSDMTTLTASENSTSTLTLSNLPSTLATINLADSGTGDTLAASYSSGPSALTLNSFGLDNAATNFTSLNAPLTINGKMLTTLAGDAQNYAAGNITALGTMTSDATAITVTTDNLASGLGIGTTELTIGAITDNVLGALTITGGNFSDVSVNAAAALTTTSAEFATLAVTSGTGGSVALGAIVADSAAAVSTSYTVGAQGSLALNGGGVSSTFDAAAVTVSGSIGDQGSISYGASNTIVGNTIASSTWSAGVGVGTTGAPLVLPSLGVDAVTGTIGAVSITSGISSFVTQAVGVASGTESFAPASIGAVTLSGSGNARVTLSATNAATVTSSAGVVSSAQGAVSAAGMTSSLASTTIDASSSIASFSITGSAGIDTITVGNLLNTVTAGSGADIVTLEPTGGSATSLTTVVIDTGDSNVVAAGAGLATGQDSISNISAAGSDVIVVKGTSTDTSFILSTHVLMGDGGATTTVGNEDSYTANTALVQFGDITNTADTFDIAFSAFTGAGVTAVASDAAIQALIAVDITGTVGADTITTGAQADTISGGAGVDTITGGGLGDVIDGGAGNDVIDINAGESLPAVATQTTLAGIDVITFGTGDTVDVAGVNAAAVVDATSAAVQTVTLTGTEATWTTATAAINTAITGVANEVSLIKIVDNSTDTSLDGDLDGYYLIVNDATAAIAATDTFIKLVGVTDATTIAVSAADVISFA